MADNFNTGKDVLIGFFFVLIVLDVIIAPISRFYMGVEYEFGLLGLAQEAGCVIFFIVLVASFLYILAWILGLIINRGKKV